MNLPIENGTTENGTMLVDFDPARLDWAKGEGLLPVIVQHARGGEVLMLAYMNEEALAETLRRGRVTFYSRSRQRLWTKGKSSGHYLNLQRLYLDCDGDTLLALVESAGPTCHLGTRNCFGERVQPPLSFLAELDALIEARHRERPTDSYITRLFEAGIRRIAQKVGEEGVETALAAVAQDDQALLGEAADLLFHLSIALRARGLGLEGVCQVLTQRHRAASSA